jgi:glucokinase
MKPIVLGIDIGGTNTVLGVVDEHGTCLADGTIPTRGSEPFAAFLPRLLAAAELVLEPFAAMHELHHEPLHYELRAVGIGAPNANYYTGTIEHPPNLNWQGITPLAALVREHFGVPTALTNDANAAALGEGLYGAARGMKNFIIITLGTGLGSGIVVGGEVLYGADGFAGELGHVTAHGMSASAGRVCGCGRRGCLETYASATGICRTAFELMAEYGAQSRLRAIAFNDLTAATLAREAHAGDFIAQQAFERTGAVLGASMANTVAAFSPEAIIFFGGLANAGELIMHPTREAFDAHMLNIFKGKTKLLFSALMDSNAAVLGASALAWKELRL